VQHLLISTVTGNFKSFSGSLTAENEGFSGATVRFEAQIDSIDTGYSSNKTSLILAKILNRRFYLGFLF
jgi:polyisoprenoid-binding protein YceI